MNKRKEPKLGVNLRAPSSGGERIRIDEVRRIIRNLTETLATLDDEAARALAVAREWEGNGRAASWDTADEPLHDVTIDTDAPDPVVVSRGPKLTSDGDPDLPPQHSDPTGETAMSPAEEAAIYEVLVHEIRELDMHGKLVAHCLGKIRKSDMDAKETARLQKTNSVSGICDACGKYHDPKRNRDDRLKDAGNDRMYGPDCYSAWQRNLCEQNPATRPVFERQRAKRLEPTTEDVA